MNANWCWCWCRRTRESVSVVTGSGLSEGKNSVVYRTRKEKERKTITPLGREHQLHVGL